MMSKRVPMSVPSAFGLTRFSELLPSRDPILGEDPGSFEGFHEGMVTSLIPATPYECVIAENLIAIEWELLQHRRMRDASLRKIIRSSIQQAVVKKHELDHKLFLDTSYENHLDAGGDEDDWLAEDFDIMTAEDAGSELAERAISGDPDIQEAAQDEIATLGMDPVEIMGEAYRTLARSVTRHEDKLRELERRRREVKQDFDALQKLRPIDAEVIEG